MTEPEIAGFAGAIRQVMDEREAVLRAEIEAVRREADARLAEVVQRCERAEARSDQLQRDLDAARAVADAAPLREAVVDAAGALRIVQRNGETVIVGLGDLPAMAETIAAIRRSADDGIAAGVQELAQVRRDVAEARELAGAPALRDALIDSEGALRLVQRNGDPLTVRLADLPALIAAAVAGQVDGAVAVLRSEMQSEVARGLQRLGAAPKWSKTAAYVAGDVVSLYNGRTYELRAGVKASIGSEPGEHPDVWERIGSHGFRVMRSRPDTPEPGDLFADAESHFVSDGETTTLFSQRQLKQSDVDRTVKPLAAQLQLVVARTGSTERGLEGVRDTLSNVTPLLPLMRIVNHAEALEVLVREEFR